MTKTILTCLAAGAVFAADYRAGVARVNITPEKPIYLTGYASRNRPSEGKTQDLWAKALAVQDGRGGRVVIVITDIIGLPRAISDVIAARVMKEHRLERSQLVLNSSHTHTGPLIRSNLEIMFTLKPEESVVVREYADRLTDQLVDLVGRALRDLVPVNLSLGNGKGAFAINRREPTPKGVRIGLNPSGPSDHDVPVLSVSRADGKLLAVLFGYACHNTTLGGDIYQITGDYAGYAQEAIEKANPGSTAMFVMLCGADQNPNPRGKLELAQQHGTSLAVEVKRVMDGKMTPVGGRIRSAFRIVELPFAHHSREKFEALLKDTNPIKVRHAQAMLKTYDDGRPIRKYPYPVQAVAFGKDLTLLALGGEVVVDYVLRVKKEYGANGLIAAGYSNDVMSYIPSLRVLKEGGYEAVDSMVYYGQPGPYDTDVEERIFETIARVMKSVGRKPVR